MGKRTVCWHEEMRNPVGKLITVERCKQVGLDRDEIIAICIGVAIGWALIIGVLVAWKASQ